MGGRAAEPSSRGANACRGVAVLPHSRAEQGSAVYLFMGETASSAGLEFIIQMDAFNVEQ